MFFWRAGVHSTLAFWSHSLAWCICYPGRLQSAQPAPLQPAALPAAASECGLRRCAFRLARGQFGRPVARTSPSATAIPRPPATKKSTPTNFGCA
eukprot:6694322-Pyramimonas_sp.AAC.1